VFTPSEESPNRLLIKSASIVLAALRGSTYRSVRLASSLAAALLDSLSEQPATSERAWVSIYLSSLAQATDHRSTESAASLYVDLLGRMTPQ
jgi:hypothetical protein